MYTTQEAFDIAATHLMTQYRKATRIISECVYHAPDGAKCAVGCLIPDEIYNIELEGKDIDDMFGYDYGLVVIEHIFGSKDTDAKGSELYRLLGALQYLHDQSEPREWRDKLLKLAHKFNMTTPEVLQ